MIRRKYWLPAMVVLTLVLVAQFPLHVRAYQDAAAAAAPAKVDWPQFGFTPNKNGNNTLETTINASTVSNLGLIFNVALPGGDNPDGAPVLLTSVSTSSGVKDLVFVQGEHGHITAFDANNGAVLWSKVFGTGGTNNSAPAIDPNRMFIYVNGNDGFAHKLNVADGSEVMGGGWPERTGGGKGGSQLTVATAANGHTYLYAANHGEGHITTIDTTMGSQHVFNASCSQFPDAHNPTGCTSTGARPWSRGMPYVASMDKMFFMTGTNNGNGWNGCNMWKQSWLALPADGSTHMSGGCGFPADSYTPTNWATSVGSDQDIGSGGLAILPETLSSKFPHLGVNPGKDHNIRIINLANMSGMGAPGHTGGEVQFFPFSTGSLMRAESAVWTNPADGAVWVFVVGNSGSHGFTVDVDAAGNPSLHNHWNMNNGWTTSAVVANGVLFTACCGGEHTGSSTTHRVQAINPTTGTVLWTGAIDLFHWESPIVVNGTVYMADGNSGGFTGPGGHLRAWRVPAGTDFSISATPLSQSISPGGATSYNVTVNASNGFSGSVNLGVSGLPAGATPSFSTNPITGGSGSSTLTITTSSTTPSGTYTLNITGSSSTPSLNHSTQVTLVVTGSPDFRLAGSCPTAVTAGGSTTCTVTVTSLNGYSATVMLSTSGLPTGVSATLNPTSISGGSGSSTLSVTTSSSTPTGNDSITVCGTDGTLSHCTTVTLVVNAPCVTARNGGGWVNTSFASQTSTFTAQFDVTPSSATIGGHVGISHGAQTAYTGFANIVRFNTTGTIDARNGGGYAATTTLHYTAGATYHVRMAIDIPTHHYSIFVTPPGGSEVTIGSNFAFRLEQNTVTSLNNYGLFVAATTTNTLRVCNFTVQ